MILTREQKRLRRNRVLRLARYLAGLYIGMSFPMGVNRVSKECKLSFSQAYRCIQDLKQRGDLILVEIGGHGLSNRYVLPVKP